MIHAFDCCIYTLNLLECDDGQHIKSQGLLANSTCPKLIQDFKSFYRREALVVEDGVVM